MNTGGITYSSDLNIERYITRIFTRISGYFLPPYTFFLRYPSKENYISYFFDAVKSYHQRQDTDRQNIFQNDCEPVRAKYSHKIVKFYPGTASYTLFQAMIPKGNQDAVHRLVRKKQNVYKRRQNHNIQLPMLSSSFPALYCIFLPFHVISYLPASADTIPALQTHQSQFPGWPSLP